jgi:RimJ/RimL family protein N-acetyltransferase
MDHIIETPRLFLRELTLNDASDLSLVLSDEESMRHYPHAFSQDEVRKWIERNIERYKNNGFGLWAVIRKEDNRFLGDCGITFQNIDGEILPEIGFHIIKTYCNKGYATEAADACKRYAIESLGFKSIYSYSEKGNIASQKVSSKIGMKRVKTFIKDGIEEVLLEYTVSDE